MIANTKGPIINSRAFPATDPDDNRAESSKTYMGSIALTAPDSMGFLAGSTLYGGIVTGFDENESRSDYDNNTTSYYTGCTLATPVTGLRFGGAFDYLTILGLGLVLMGSMRRKSHAQRDSLGAALCPDAPAVRFDQTLHDREAQPRAPR